jgi:hypothetical protein
MPETQAMARSGACVIGAWSRRRGGSSSWIGSGVPLKVRSVSAMFAAGTPNSASAAVASSSGVSAVTIEAPSSRSWTSFSGTRLASRPGIPIRSTSMRSRRMRSSNTT